MSRPYGKNNPNRKPSHPGEYRSWMSWKAAMQRCYNPNNKAYRRYGGRGIRICARWHSFPAFLDDMGCRPDGLTIGRIDNDGDYEPTNCRWETYTEQNRNKSVTVRLESGQTLIDAAEQAGIRPSVVRQRHYKGARSTKALFDPKVDKRSGPLTFRGRTQSALAWSKEIGVSPDAIYRRLHVYGWSLERTLTEARYAVGRGAKIYEYAGKMYSIPGLSILSGIGAQTLISRLKRGLSVKQAVEMPLSQSHSHARRPNGRPPVVVEYQIRLT